MRRQYFKREYFIEARGFTLLEGLISMSIFLLVMFAIYSTFASSAGTFAKGDRKADIHQNARASMEFMVREIRHAGYFPENFSPMIIPPGPAAGCPAPFVGIISATEIPAINPTTIQITMCGDVDGDNGSELVVYTWSGDTDLDNVVDLNENEIRRQITDDGGLQAADVMALNISQFSLRFFDNLNPPNEIPLPIGPCVDNVSPGCNIRRVVITMTGSEPQQQSAAIGGRTQSPFATRVPDYQLVTDVRPRNLGL